MKLGLQLYSVSEPAGKDFQKTVEAVAKIGYDGVEFAGYGGLSAKDLKKLMADNGLEMAASHEGLPGRDNWEKTLEYAAEAGIPKLIIPYMSAGQWFPSRPTFRNTLKEVTEYTNLAATYGIQIGYHNHGHELMEYGGMSILDRIAKYTPDNFLLEVDCFWVEFGEQNAYEFLKTHTEKATTICHFKQMLEQEEKANVTLDKGYIDFKQIADLLKANNAEWAIIEQEPGSVTDQLAAAKINHDYTRTIM